MNLFQQRTAIVKTANLSRPLVLYWSLKTLHPSSWCHFLPLHTPLTLSCSSSWLRLCDLWWEKRRHPGVRQEERPSVMGPNVLPTHCEAGACGGLYGPSDVENRETDPPLTTGLCIQTHPRREALPVMATCPICTYTSMDALRINSATHIHSHTDLHTQGSGPWHQCELYMRPLWSCSWDPLCLYVLVWHRDRCAPLQCSLHRNHTIW